MDGAGDVLQVLTMFNFSLYFPVSFDLYMAKFSVLIAY